MFPVSMRDHGTISSETLVPWRRGDSHTQSLFRIIGVNSVAVIALRRINLRRLAQVKYDL